MKVEIYQFPSIWGLANISPFCMKLEVYCRLSGLDYTIISDFNHKKAPKKKFPFVKIGKRTLSDSSLIIDYLESKNKKPLDSHLSSCDKGIALAMQRLLEDHLYWVLVYSRWIDPKGWEMIKTDALGAIPKVLRPIIFPVIQSSVKKNLFGHGLGRHDAQTIYNFGIQDIQALSDFLGKKKFMMGENITTLDSCAYAFLANILWDKLDFSPLKKEAKKHKNLENYCNRMKKLCEI